MRAVIRGIFLGRYKDYLCSICECLDNKALPYKWNKRGSESYCVNCTYTNTPRSKGQRCDEFIFQNMPKNKNISGLYLIERKTKAKDAKKIEQQLQGGANFICRFIQKDPALQGYHYDFIPIAVSRGASRPILKALQAKKIKLGNISRRIRHVIRNDHLPPIAPPAN